MKLNEAVARRINTFLSRTDWSRYKLAKEVGVSPNAIDKILDCKNQSIEFDTIISLAHAFGMRTCEFVDDENLDFENLTFKKF